MKKYLIIIIMLCLALTTKAQTAAMPTIIVFPSDTWMTDHSYMQELNDNGQIKLIPDYSLAFKSNRDINSAISALQKVLTERGFEEEDLKQLLDNYEQEAADDAAASADGHGAETSNIDALMQQARPDIRINLDYAAEPFGPYKNISFNIQAVDAYTSEQVANCQGTIQNTMDPIELALRKGISGRCDDFCQQLVNYFLDLRENGRKVNIIFRAASGSGIDFNDGEIGEDGDTYGDFIFEWLKKKAIKMSAKQGRMTSKMTEVKFVRIPFFDPETKEPITPRKWAKGIRSAFNAETGLKVKNDSRSRSGLGLLNFIVYNNNL